MNLQNSVVGACIGGVQRYTVKCSVEQEATFKSATVKYNSYCGCCGAVAFNDTGCVSM